MSGINSAFAIADAPSWLIEEIRATTTKTAISRQKKSPVPNFLSDGRRNTDLTTLAGFMRSKGLPSDLIERSLQALNEGLSSRLPNSEVTTIAAGMERYPPHIKIDELYVADLLVSAFAGLIRHCSAIGWLFYDGRVWRPDDGDKFVTQIGKRVVEEFCAYAATLDNGSGKPLFSAKTIATAKRRSFIANILKLASSNPETTASIKDFDADANLLCLENGTLDLSTRLLRNHRPTDMLTRMMPIAFDANADCPIFDRFLSETLPADDANFVMRSLAYALTGTGKEQKFVIFHGVGKNGKSTLTNIVCKLFGEYATTAEPKTFLRRPDASASNDVARLATARLVVTSEFQTGAVLDAPLVKRLTGQDSISARYLYKEYFEFQPRFLLLMITNFMPVLEGSDSAVARRVLAVPFKNIVPTDKVDQTLDQKLWQERSGILNRLLEALKSYQELGLAPSQNVIDKTGAFLDDTNLLKRFVDNECELGAALKVSVTTLYNRFFSMCAGEGIKPMSQRSFNQLVEQAYSLSKRRVSSGMEWEGIKTRAAP